MFVPVSRVTDWVCPLTYRMLFVNQLVYPNLGQMIALHPPRISSSEARFRELHLTLCSPQEADLIQMQIVASIHQAAQRIMSRDRESRHGVMCSEDFMRVFELKSKLEIHHHRSLGCPKGFERRVRMFPYFYELQHDVAPFDALESFFVGPTVTDCGGAVEAVFMKAIADTVGEKRFNALFSLPLTRFRLQNKGILGSTSLLPLFTQTICSDFESRDVSQLKSGARLYFRGVPWYLAKRPLGVGSGLHAICMKDPMKEDAVYWGIGLKQLSTYEQVLEFLLGKYNTPRSEEERVLIDSVEGDPLNQFIELHEYLGLYRKEVKQCLADPERHLFLDEVRSHMGFLGYEHVDAISPEILAVIRSTSVEELKTERFLQSLALMQTALTCQKIAEKRNRVME